MLFRSVAIPTPFTSPSVLGFTSLLPVMHSVSFLSLPFQIHISASWIVSKHFQSPVSPVHTLCRKPVPGAALPLVTLQNGGTQLLREAAIPSHPAIQLMV